MGTKNKPGSYDCYANAHPDEPMFVLLGRDALAPGLVEEWARLRELRDGPSAKVEEARRCARTMREYAAPGPAVTGVKITINGAVHETSSAALSYEDLVKLAGMTGTPSMTWKGRAPHGGESSGSMHPGSYTIVPSDGLVVNVAHTGNA